MESRTGRSGRRCGRDVPAVMMKQQEQRRPGDPGAGPSTRPACRTDLLKRRPAPYGHRRKQHRPKAGAMFASLNPHHRTRSRFKQRAASAMKADEELRRVAASYTGPVTLCPPGKPRAPAPRASRPENEAVTWLRRQRGGGWPKKETPKAKRQRLKIERARVAAHNAAVRKAHGLSKGEIG